MNSRRQFLRRLAITASSPILLGARSLAQDAPPAIKLTEDDPVAMALGYKEDATKVDVTKFPQFKPDSHCEICALYTGKPGEASGPCSVFANKIVIAKGWCATFAPKPPAVPGAPAAPAAPSAPPTPAPPVQ